MPDNLVVFCPGYSGLPPAKHNPLLKSLASHGYDTIGINYKLFGRGDITETANRVLHVVEPLVEHYKSINLIGHSMGGLVARKALCINPTVADSLVTIGTPHRGTQAASRPFWWLGGKSVAQMQSDSIFLYYLGCPSVPTLTIGGEWDILVKDASLPDHNTNENVHHITIPKGEHSLMLLSARVHGEILSWLTYEVLDSVGFHGQGQVNEV